MPTEAEAIIKQLENTARRRKLAEGQAAHWRDETDALILAGHEAKLPKQQLARAAGLTKQTVYTLLRKSGVKV